ncbi:cytochrome c biogenesis protein transmembrane region [Dickeya chrysanthemi Ech1591]|uniref:Thiol:disulfide interchange protein DsbD n=1 Tax=Dickeya chrysanthemi (strain Ech1591) TaxID=561229 RepID=C6CKI1_DICC1|nr:protein-disulfide reductase DsbD [Dickeya chrysanthemi]ACT08346.1 cytochrome c biogenesis protein transmembrane region [Dickeya chrysanthemi Ech1591]
MAQRILTLTALCLSLFFSTLVTAQNPFGRSAQSQFLPVDQAFAFDFQQRGDQLTVDWQIHPGYYLYRQQIKLDSALIAPPGVTLPPGESHRDEFFGEVAIYRQSLTLTIPLRDVPPGASLSITYQGCADAGFCYPPETRSVPLSAISSGTPAAPAVITPQPDRTHTPQLPFSPFWALLIGIGVAFTPCVLPMYPLISGLILGRQQRLSTGRTLLLTLVYVQGMALTYTLLGLVVAAAGLRFQAALQHPYVLIGLSVMFAALALSMFGVYSLQLPSSLQTRLTLWSNRQQSGSATGVFAMGALAGLICSPCTTAPLSALLLYIAQSGNLLAGGGSLYLYALGMGLPLMAITLFGNRLLPKRGPWMNHVKEGFGFVILALPVFLLGRVLGEVWEWRMWALLGVAFFGWAFTLSLRSHAGGMRAVQILLFLGALLAARPLQDWLFAPAQPQPASAGQLHFTSANTLDELTTALGRSDNRITMLDLYADWCVACKEFEKYTFRDATVQQSLSAMQRLQADVTANNETQRALLQHLNVLGLPTILFFDASGREIPGSRVTGFMDAAAFAAHLQTLKP